MCAFAALKSTVFIKCRCEPAFFPAKNAGFVQIGFDNFPCSSSFIVVHFRLAESVLYRNTRCTHVARLWKQSNGASRSIRSADACRYMYLSVNVDIRMCELFKNSHSCAKSKIMLWMKSPGGISSLLLAIGFASLLLLPRQFFDPISHNCILNVHWQKWVSINWELVELKFAVLYRTHLTTVKQLFAVALYS